MWDHGFSPGRSIRYSEELAKRSELLVRAPYGSRGKGVLTAEAIASELSKVLNYRRIPFETGRMAPILFHELRQVCFTGSSRLRLTRPTATMRWRISLALGPSSPCM